MRNVRTKVVIAYQLAYDTNSRLVCARGPLHILEQLRGVPEVQWYQNGTEDFFVAMPDCKLSYLILESLANPEAASPLYVEARQRAMGLTDMQLAEVNQYLAALNLNEYGDDHIVSQHQKEFVYHALHTSCNRGIFNASEQGTGKTLCSLIMAHIWRSRKVLVICPKTVIPEWDIQYNDWFLQRNNPWKYKVWEMFGVDTKTRAKAFRILAKEQSNTICVINYDVVSEVRTAIEEYNPDLICIDESHRVKSPNAKVTKAVFDLCEKTCKVINSTGTPVGNHVGDLWSQVRMINPGSIHTKYNDYLSRFAVYGEVYGPGGVPLVRGGYQIKKIVACQDPAGIMRILEPIWFRATKAACLRLPRKVKRKIYLEMPAATRKLYKDVIELGEQALGKGLSLNGQLVVAIRLQQIAGGHVPKFTYGPDQNELKTIERVECPKITWMQDFANDVLLNEASTRCIVWCRFNVQVSTLVTVLTDILGPTRVAGVIGTTKDTEVLEIRNSFNSRAEEGIQVVVAQIDKIYSGLNLQACDYNIYYSNTWSYLKRAQSEDRSHRLGRKEDVQYIDLIIKDTIDEIVLNTLESKRDLALRLAPDTVSGIALVSETDPDFMPAETVLEENNCYAT